MEELKKDVNTETEEVEMNLDLTNKRTLRKITSQNIDKEILKKYCTGKLTNDELSRMTPSARKQAERKLKQLRKISKRLQLVADEEPKQAEPKKKEIKYSEESLKHKHDIEIDID